MDSEIHNVWLIDCWKPFIFIPLYLKVNNNHAFLYVIDKFSELIIEDTKKVQMKPLKIPVKQEREEPTCWSLPRKVVLELSRK